MLKQRFAALAQVFIVMALFACQSAAGPAARIYLAPSSVGLPAGAVQQFKVFSIDSEGKEEPVSASISWGVDSSAGSIDQNGRFTAVGEPAKYPGAVTATVGGLAAAASIEVVNPKPADGYTISRRLGGPVQPGHLNSPQWLALDSKNCLYVVDTGESRISVYDTDGRYLRYWEVNSGDCGGASGIAIDQKDNVIISDSGAESIYRYDTTGAILGSWTLPVKDEDGSFSPSGVAADASGFIYVADQYRNSICKFDPNGLFITSWGEDDSVIDMSNPQGLAVDKDGNLYATSVYGGSVFVFNTSGRFLDKWGSGNKQWNDNGLFNQPTGVAAGPGGEVYVSDWTGGNIQKFSPDGRRLAKWGQEGTAVGEFSDPWGLAIDKQGFVYVADSDNHRIQKLDRQGKVVAHWGDEGTGKGTFLNPVNVAIDSKHNIYVLDQGNKRVQKFDSNWTFLTSWRPSVNQDSEFLGPRRIVADLRDNIYIADTGVGKVMKFNSGGKMLNVWKGRETKGEDEDGFPADSRLSDVALGPDGCAYMLNSGNRTIEKYDSDGEFVSTIDISKEATEFGPEELVVDSKGNLYVLDSNDNSIRKYDPSGVYLYDLMDSLRQNGILESPGTICMSPDDKLFMRDYCADKTCVLSTSGELISIWTTNPGGVDVANSSLPVFDSQGNMYVAGPDHLVIAFTPIK